MSFDDLMNDRIDVLKESGEKVLDLKASVQNGKIFLNAKGVLIEPNDLIVRNMSNGGVETFRVIDPCFHEEFHGIEAHYQMKVQKLGIPEARTAVQNITNHNTYVSGPNARINNHSVDNSVNTISINEGVLDQLKQLRQELSTAELGASERAEALEIVDQIESSVRTGSAKKAVVNVLLKALPQVANVATIASGIAAMLG